VPKEHLVAVFFAVGCFLPVLLAAQTFAVVAAMCLFGALCWLNCVALARWERVPRSAMDAGTAWAAAHLREACVALFCCCALLLAVPGAHAIALPVALSCAGLVFLDIARTRMQPVPMRAAADAVLLTPLLLWPLLPLIAR
jgi:ABC-type phosphate transport system permease subunit